MAIGVGEGAPLSAHEQEGEWNVGEHRAGVATGKHLAGRLEVATARGVAVSKSLPGALHLR
jgi:hypothetical protein